MALDSARLKTAILAKVETILGEAPAPWWGQMAEAIAEAVVEELTVHAVVNGSAVE